MHNYITSHERSYLFRIKYKFRIVVKYINFDSNEYQIFVTEGFDFKDIEPIDFKKYLNTNKVFYNILLDMKNTRNNLDIVNDTVFCIIDVNNLNHHELKNMSLQHTKE